jgi:2-oxoacid:acceptor oxidoreductase delta subunit (pyruvate/2-ketoisovalerate family)
MPRGDGTGPFGKGPGMGRGMGRGLGRGRGMGRGGMFRRWTPPESEHQFQTQTSKQSAKAVVDEDKCAGCGICVDVCPQGAITMDRVAKIDVNKCTGCSICVNECPRSAISLKG